MKTSRIGFLGLFILLNGMLSYAQPDRGPNDRRKEIEAHKIAYITSQLKLTPEEAQVFWPVYNKCQENRRVLRKANKEKHERKMADGTSYRVKIDEMTDSEVEAIVNNQIIFQQQDLDIKKECLAMYKDVLPIKKVAKLYQAEKKFKQQLLKRIKGDKVQQRGEPHRSRP